VKTRLLSLAVTAAFLSAFLYPVVSGCARTGSGSPGLPEPAVQKEGAGGIEKDSYLGLKVAEFRATGFFRLEKLGERWFLVTPEGHPFYRIGINGVTPWYGNYKEATFEKKYKGDIAAWGKEAIARVKGWGFNTLEFKTAKELIRLMKTGKVEKMPYSVIVPFVESSAIKRTQFPDVFSPEFEAMADGIAKETAEKISGDPYLLGYFLGNELDFDLSQQRAWRSRWVRTLLKKGPGTPGFTAFVDLAKQKYGSVEEFNKAHGTSVQSLEELDAKSLVAVLKEDSVNVAGILRDYNGLLAERFYEVTTKAIRKYDPNHLILGSRFGGGAEPEVLRKTAPYTDIVSLNKYTANKGKLLEMFAEFSRLTGGKPLHLSEFSFLLKGRNGGTGHGTYPPVDSQRARGENYARIVQAGIEIPYLIGYSWHEYMDPSEDMNFGLIDKNDRVYEEPVSLISQENRKIEARFAEIVRSLGGGKK
jgi:hypothetical protein